MVVFTGTCFTIDHYEVLTFIVVFIDKTMPIKSSTRFYRIHSTMDSHQVSNHGVDFTGTIQVLISTGISFADTDFTRKLKFELFELKFDFFSKSKIDVKSYG